MWIVQERKQRHHLFYSLIYERSKIRKTKQDKRLETRRKNVLISTHWSPLVNLSAEWNLGSKCSSTLESKILEGAQQGETGKCKKSQTEFWRFLVWTSQLPGGTLPCCLGTEQLDTEFSPGVGAGHCLLHAFSKIFSIKWVLSLQKNSHLGISGENPSPLKSTTSCKPTTESCKPAQMGPKAAVTSSKFPGQAHNKNG